MPWYVSGRGGTCHRPINNLVPTVLIWYKSELTNSVKLIKTGQFYIWLEMDKGLTASEENILLCATYIPPLESPYYNEESFSILEEAINHFQSHGHILICGDLNARTGQRPEIHQQAGR